MDKKIAINFVNDWKAASGKERLFMAGGAIMLVLALIGVALPIVPQVPFAVISAYLFSKGNPRLHRWIRNNKYLGSPVKDWEDHRVVRPKLKAFSTVAMLSGAALGHWKLDLKLAIALDVAFAACIVFLLTRKSSSPLGILDRLNPRN